MLIRLFRDAGATGHVFLFKGGKARNKGLAYSGFIGFQTTVAVVPTTSQVLNFSVEAKTKDKQDVTVTGNLKIALAPAIAVSKFDFTVNVGDGAYLSPWEQVLREIVIEQVIAPIYDRARTLDVQTAIVSHKDFEDAVKAAVTGQNNPLASKGITVESCSIVTITADDEEVDQAIGSKERQSMLTESDRALHERRLKAAENDRAVRTYESETAKKLEEERANLIKQQVANQKTQAEGAAAATKITLAPLAEVAPGKILGAALIEMAKAGRVGTISIAPELLAALNEK